MVKTYETVGEAYATRQELWEARQRRQQAQREPQHAAAAVPLVDRYMFDLQGFFVVKVRGTRRFLVPHPPVSSLSRRQQRARH